MSEEKQKTPKEEKFMEIWKIIKTIENKNGIKLHWCEKGKCLVTLETLKELKCWVCSNNIMNKGNCDPL